MVWSERGWNVLGCSEEGESTSLVGVEGVCGQSAKDRRGPTVASYMSMHRAKNRALSCWLEQGSD